MDYNQWLLTVPASVTRDTLWRMAIYRLALFLGDLSWTDVSTLNRDRRTVSVGDQLYRAVGSIGANVAEGYSRGTGKDRARFFEYALGSARESRHWYLQARHVLGDEPVADRIEVLSQIIRLLLTIVPAERNDRIREAPAVYSTEHIDGEMGESHDNTAH